MRINLANNYINLVGIVIFFESEINIFLNILSISKFTYVLLLVDSLVQIPKKIISICRNHTCFPIEIVIFYTNWLQFFFHKWKNLRKNQLFESPQFQSWFETYKFFSHKCTIFSKQMINLKSFLHHVFRKQNIHMY